MTPEMMDILKLLAIAVGSAVGNWATQVTVRRAIAPLVERIEALELASDARCAAESRSPTLLELARAKLHAVREARR